MRTVEERRSFPFLCPQTSCLCCSWPCGCWEGWAMWPLPTTHWVGPLSWPHSAGSPHGGACWELWGSWPPQLQLLFWGRTGDYKLNSFWILNFAVQHVRMLAIHKRLCTCTSHIAEGKCQWESMASMACLCLCWLERWARLGTGTGGCCYLHSSVQ